MTFSLLTEHIKHFLIISKGCLYLSLKEYGNDFFKMSPKELVKFLNYVLCSLVGMIHLSLLWLKA